MGKQMGLDFDSLVREHHAGLRAFIRALGADEAWVDDLAQEVFLVAYRKQAEFRLEDDPGKWLRGIARRCVMGERSKRARRYRLMHEGITDILMNLGIGDEPETTPNEQLMSTMTECAKDLPESQRQLLELRYHGGRKANDLAEELGMSSAAIRKKLQRIRLVIRQCMESKLGEVSL